MNRQLMATHEAGHAVMGMLAGALLLRVHFFTLPDGRESARCNWWMPRLLRLQWGERQGAICALRRMAGGPIASWIYAHQRPMDDADVHPAFLAFLTGSYGASDDIENNKNGAPSYWASSAGRLTSFGNIGPLSTPW
jgi:hypothetical protein